jgi:two-component system, chemotaxis family, chemotaxis protein CheY
MELKDCRFLVVDDHLLLRQMVGAMLSDWGITNVDMAVDGVVALDKIKTAAASSTPYNIVLLDWSMPNLNGYEVLTACRQDASLNGMAIVMLTAESEDINIIKALNAGATGYVTKPFTPDTLIAKLEDVIMWFKNRKKS